MKNWLLLAVFLFAFVVMGLSLRGNLGNPTPEDLQNDSWTGSGPFELSPERGRFALTYSLIEDKSFFFSLPIARFAVPDLGFRNGKYVSLFAPAVSFIVVPGYVLGKMLGASQVGTYAVIALFGLINLLLVRSIAKLLGASEKAALLGGLIFLFATPAFSYAVNFYQHHISTFLILASIYLLLRFKSIWPLFGVSFLAAASLSVDYPNAFLLFPVVIFAVLRLFRVEQKGKPVLKVKPGGLFTLLAALLPMAFFLWFNFHSYGSPWQLAGTVANVGEIDSSGNPTVPQARRNANLEKVLNPEQTSKTAVGFFKTRSFLNGLYIHLVSPDRGVLFFAPIILFAWFGVKKLWEAKSPVLGLLLGIISINLALYSLWGDPWGGWAFGSRYQIPSYGLAAILLAVGVGNIVRKWIYIIPFLIIMSFSIAVNTAGALTSSTNPPQIETQALSQASGKPEKYTVERNLDTIKQNTLKSVVFRSFGKKYLSAWNYYTLITILLIAVSGGLLLADKFFINHNHAG